MKGFDCIFFLVVWVFRGVERWGDYWGGWLGSESCGFYIDVVFFFFVFVRCDFFS